MDITTNPEVTGPVSGTYRELSPEVKELLDELKQLRVEREKAQKALSDLRKWLDEQKQKK